MSELELIEQLADKEHASWTRWMMYLFQVCEKQPDGSFLIPPTLVERWQRQVDTPYVLLSEKEKQSDRDEVAHILPIIHAYLQMLISQENTDTIASTKPSMPN